MVNCQFVTGSDLRLAICLEGVSPYAFGIIFFCCLDLQTLSFGPVAVGLFGNKTWRNFIASSLRDAFCLKNDQTYINESSTRGFFPAQGALEVAP